MKQILLSIALGVSCLVSVSCTTTPASITVDGIAATSSKKFGGKQMLYVKRGDTTVVIGDDNVESFRDGVGAVKWGIGAWALSDVVGTVTGGLTSTTNAKTAADVSKTGTTEATKQLGITEATKIKGMELEAAAMGLGQ